MDIKNTLEQKLGKSIADSSKQEIYVALLNITKDMSVTGIGKLVLRLSHVSSLP